MCIRRSLKNSKIEKTTNDNYKKKIITEKQIKSFFYQIIFYIIKIEFGLLSNISSPAQILFCLNVFTC